MKKNLNIKNKSIFFFLILILLLVSPLIITCFVSENKITQTEYINVNEDLSIGNETNNFVC